MNQELCDPKSEKKPGADWQRIMDALWLPTNANALPFALPSTSTSVAGFSAGA
jgi:hypothetical protein